MYGTSALYRGPVSGRVQRRLTCFPGQAFQCLRWLTGPAPELDSSSTGGVYCVSGRIPALSVSDPLHHPRWIGVFAFAHGHCCHERAGCGRYPSRPASRWERPGCVMTICTGLRKLLDQKRVRFPSVPPPAREEHSAPQPIGLRDPESGNARIHLYNEFLQTILPAFTVPTRTSDAVQPLRGYGRLMGSDSHPRILRLSPLISRRIGYLRRSRIFRQ